VVTHGVLEAVLLGRWVEVASCRFEVRRFAERLLVDVNGVLAHGEVFEVDLDDELVVFAGGEGGGSGVLTVGGLEGDGDCSFGGLGKGWEGEEADGKGGCGKAHTASLLKFLISKMLKNACKRSIAQDGRFGMNGVFVERVESRLV
jgi:hypothetical protein